jgi:hypothetical protein
LRPAIMKRYPIWLTRLAFMFQAASLLWGAAPVRADSTSTAMVVFGVDATNSPKRAFKSGSGWGSASSLSSVGGETHWVVLRNCPTRDEMALGTFDVNGDGNVLFYNGSSWTSVTEVNTDGDETDDRNLDIAYEQTSGDCLIVYYDKTENNFGYRSYNGSSLSSETDLSRSNLDSNDYVALYPKPNSNQIVLITIGQVNGSDAISANIWNGSSWAGWTTILNGMSTNDNECAGFAFESLSGDGGDRPEFTEIPYPQRNQLVVAEFNAECRCARLVGEACQRSRVQSDPLCNAG